MAEYTLRLNEPWTFLDVRKNPVEGRRLTFQLTDGTIIIVDVSHSEYTNTDLILARLAEKIEAHKALQSL